MSHTTARWSGLPCNKADNRFGRIFLNPAGCFSFHATTDFSDHDNAVGSRVIHQQFHRFPGRSANDGVATRSEEHTSELQSLMRISYAVFCLKKKTYRQYTPQIVRKSYTNHSCLT